MSKINILVLGLLLLLSQISLLAQAKTGASGVVVDAQTGEEQLAMSDNHSGLGVLLGYELPCGLQFNASGQYSISDILAFAHPNTMSAHPLKVMVGFGWRF